MPLGYEIILDSTDIFPTAVLRNSVAKLYQQRALKTSTSVVAAENKAVFD